MKIHIPAFVPMAKCNEHLAHGPIDIDLGVDIVKIVRCKDCCYCIVQAERGKSPIYFCDMWGGCEVKLDDFCSRGSRIREDV